MSALAGNSTGGSALTIENGYNLTTPGDFSNAGTMTVGNASTLEIGPGGTNSYTQSGGTTQGIGKITGAVTINGGTVQPGLPGAPGTLSVNGSYTHNSGTFSEQMTGAAVGQFGVLNVTGGNITLGAGADLLITLLNGFNPVGNQYTILNDVGGVVAGTFANAPAAGFQMDGVNWTIAYNPTDIILDAVSQVTTNVTATWAPPAPAGNTGNWTTAAEWNCNCVPNNGAPANTDYSAVLDSPGKTLTLDSTSAPSSITVSHLTLTAGTLDIGIGASLNVVSNGLTDINANSGLILAGTFANGFGSALAGLSSVEGTLTLLGQTLNVTPVGGTLANTGVVNLQQGTAVTLSGNLTTSGTINTGNGVNDAGNNRLSVSGTLSNSGAITLAGTGDSLSAQLTNSGAINLNGNNESLSDGGAFTNTGGNGLLTLAGNLDSVAIGGDFTNTNGGGFGISGANGSVSITGAFTNNSLSALVSQGIGNGAKVGGAFSNAGGDLEMVDLNEVLTVGDLFTNSGSVNVGPGETLNANGNYTQNGGTTNVGGTSNAPTFSHNGGTTTLGGGLISTTGFNLGGGLVQGTGTISGAVTMTGGTLAPGLLVPPASSSQMPGALTINGNFTQLAGSVFEELINSTSNGLLNVTGSVTLDPMPSLMIDLLGGFDPANGMSFDIVDYGGSETGAFSITDPLFNNGTQQWVISSYNGGDGDDIVLTAEPVSKVPTPEPDSLVLFGTGLLAIGIAMKFFRAANDFSR